MAQIKTIHEKEDISGTNVIVILEEEILMEHINIIK